MATKKDVFTAIDALADELGTAASHRAKMEQEIGDLETELNAIDAMLDNSASREEFDEITSARKECELDLKFARNRLRRFNMSPRIDSETLDDLMTQLSTEADNAAAIFRKKVERPLAEIVAAGDEFDATINRVCNAVQRLHSVQGSLVDRDDTLRRAFSRFELGTLRSRAYKDNLRIVHPDLRDALMLASTAKQPTFDTH